jgi:hypothetical protein
MHHRGGPNIAHGAPQAESWGGAQTFYEYTDLYRCKPFWSMTCGEAQARLHCTFWEAFRVVLAAKDIVP